jgi:hypothetical protein
MNHWPMMRVRESARLPGWLGKSAWVLVVLGVVAGCSSKSNEGTGQTTGPDTSDAAADAGVVDPCAPGPRHQHLDREGRRRIGQVP